MAPRIKQYIVEKIVGDRIAEDGVREFCIKWQGYKEKDNSWAPEEDLNCPERLEEYLKEKRQKNNPRATTTSRKKKADPGEEYGKRKQKGKPLPKKEVDSGVEVLDKNVKKGQKRKRPDSVKKELVPDEDDVQIIKPSREAEKKPPVRKETTNKKKEEELPKRRACDIVKKEPVSDEDEEIVKPPKKAEKKPKKKEKPSPPKKEDETLPRAIGLKTMEDGKLGVLWKNEDGRVSLIPYSTVRAQNPVKLINLYETFRRFKS